MEQRDAERASSLPAATDEKRMHNELQEEQACGCDANLLASCRLYTSHVFAGDSLALD